MFTIPTIVTTDDLRQRAYVTFYLNNDRVREYNGKKIGLRISPNTAESISQRNELLEKLRFEFHKALDSNSYPLAKVTHEPNQDLKQQETTPNEAIVEPTALLLLFKATRSKLRSELSRKYKRNLKSIYRQFKKFMFETEQNGTLAAISISRIDTFLNQFRSSGTYYMNKRRDLGVLFSMAGRMIDQPVETIQHSQRKKSKAKLHKTYEKHQVRPILNYLKAHNPNLYICCLLTYGSWLRPHEEIRLLTAGNFTSDYTEVHLSGGENKGGRVRSVYIPDYIRQEVLPILTKLNRNDNIFSLTKVPFNEYYFNTQWSRAWAKMHELGLIYEDQTIYSFRHTAAVDLYRRKKDVYLLQQLLGHSSITVTLKYLRNLGELNTAEMQEAAPQLY